ncbi:MAG: hypothetical protein HZA92_12250 [Verrucomicrobia bacterium]|nr:hypothetical protein [Verrucomicrobiota bacterium]
MKDQLPSPDFDHGRYDRPNQNWECGRTCDGCPCRIGPSPSGACRATSECRPVLEKKEGEEKGRWRCTRPKEHGGPCANGPLSDGGCACPVPKCRPHRTLRNLRGSLCVGVTAVTLAVLLIGFFGPWQWRFISPGQMSSPHHGVVFSQMKHSWPGSDGCGACHTAAHGDLREWMRSAFRARPGPLEPHRLHTVTAGDMTEIDRSCLACHPGHKFHQPNVTRDHSCSSCHREHQGRGRMPAPADTECLSCHGSGSVMEASRKAGEKLSTAAFAYRQAQGRALFQVPRPERGYTMAFKSFAADHPEFQLHSQKLQDTNSLRFNHSLHLSDLVKRSGQPLSCADCHQPAAAGAHFQPPTFAKHCQGCHALQFDARNPQMRLPHGDPAGVRAYLRSLPTQYADLARRTGMTAQADTEKFVTEQMRQLRERVFSGENLEQQLFFSSDPSKQLAVGAAPGNIPPRARFAGCAYCHDVKPGGADGLPQIVPVTTPDRWLIRGEFNHAKHNIVSCTQCHAAQSSHRTEDILLPTKKSCTECHSSQGGVSQSCSTCHSYHTVHVSHTHQHTKK